MTRSTVADEFCRLLIGEGVAVVFGHPGGAILPFYDSLQRVGAPRHILMRHEQAAAHAADGYARATGRTGVCIATSGPGATNLVTGLATAMMDSVPMVAITGQVPTSVRGTDAFQETDVLGVTMPVTKHGFSLERAADLTRVVQEAFRIARSGRPGPVLIDIPKDVQNAALVHAEPATTPLRRMPAAAFDNTLFTRILELLGQAERPLIMAGRGVIISDTAPALRRLAERADLPVVTTLLGLDAFPATHPQALGMPGMHGTVRACHAIQRADLILGLGLRFDDRVTGPVRSFAPNACIVHIDIDTPAAGRTVRAALRMNADLRAVLPAFADAVTPRRCAEWWSELQAWPRAAAPAAEWTAPDHALTARLTTRSLAARIAAARSIVVTDVGQHQMWIAQELRDAEPRTHLTSGGLGAMGYALPAAIGAAIACPRRSVWVVAGDGGFQMTLQELATVAQERIPLRIAVFNNGYLGMVRQWQELFYDRRYSAVELSSPDFPCLARAFGIPGRAVECAGQLADALDWAEQSPGPVLLDLRVAREENVFPMVPPGAALHEVVAAPVVGAV
jgi:acetolactate synthase-1/2/3 large subunit